MAQSKTFCIKTSLVKVPIGWDRHRLGSKDWKELGLEKPKKPKMSWPKVNPVVSRLVWLRSQLAGKDTE